MTPNLLQLAHQATVHLSDEALDELLSKMVIVLSSPRSGSTLLFEQLTKQDHVWSIGNESHIIFSQFPHLKYEDDEFTSGALNADHADPKTTRLIKAAFVFLLKNNKNQRIIDPHLKDKPNQPLIIEKTPRNALNITFLLKIFPKARFIFLYRDPKQTIASLVEAWQLGLQTGRFATHVNLPDWHLPAWCFLLPKGWQSLKGKSLVEICCFQWVKSNHAIFEYVTKTDKKNVKSIEFTELVEDTQKCLQNILSFLFSDKYEQQVDYQLNPSKTTLSYPKVDKWKKYETEIMAIENQWSPVWEVIKSAKN